jgi:hypothetical protein
MAILSLALFLLFAAAQAHWLWQPHSDSYSSLIEFPLSDRTYVVLSECLGVNHRTHALDNNSRYSNGRDSLSWHGLGFDLRVNHLVNYPRWRSHGDNQTVEWGPIAEWSIAIPCWFLLAATAIVPG